MNNPSHRVLTKAKAATIAIAVLIIATPLALWASDWIKSYSKALSVRIDTDLESATTDIKTAMFWVAAIHLAVMGALVAYLLRAAIAGMRHQIMPPPGSWVVEGRPIRTGSEAVRAAKVVIALAMLIALLGAGITIVIFHLADSLSLGP